MWFSHSNKEPWKRGQVQIPEQNFTSSAKILNFAWVQAGPREIIQTAANSPLKPFLQSCFHFQATLEIWKYQEDICSLTWKRHFFSSREKLFDWDFFIFFSFSVRCPRNVLSFCPRAKPLLFTCIPRRGLTKPSITQQRLGSGTKPLQSWED